MTTLQMIEVRIVCYLTNAVGVLSATSATLVEIDFAVVLVYRLAYKTDSFHKEV